MNTHYWDGEKNIAQSITIDNFLKGQTQPI